MLTLQESPAQLGYRYRGVLVPAIAVGGTSSGLLAGSDPWLALQATGCAVGAGSVAQADPSSASSAQPDASLAGARRFAGRSVLQAPAGPVPLGANHRSDPTVLKDARRIHAWP